MKRPWRFNKTISFIHSGRFYSAFSSSLLLRSAPNTARILCRSFMPKHHRQLRVKDLPKVPTRWLKRNSNPRPFGRMVWTLNAPPHPTFTEEETMAIKTIDRRGDHVVPCLVDRCLF